MGKGWQRLKWRRLLKLKVSKPELEAAKSKLVLPNIEAEVDEDYIQYKESLEKQIGNAETKKRINPLNQRT